MVEDSYVMFGADGKFGLTQGDALATSVAYGRASPPGPRGR